MSDARTIENAVVSVLAVGGYPIARVHAKLEALRANGVFDPLAFSDADEERAFMALIRAGYERGPIVTKKMAQRLIGVHAAVRDGRLARIVDLLDRGQARDAEALAFKIPGIGPKVFEQFVALQVTRS